MEESLVSPAPPPAPGPDPNDTIDFADPHGRPHSPWG